jgi:hypothetical protein
MCSTWRRAAGLGRPCHSIAILFAGGKANASPSRPFHTRDLGFDERPHPWHNQGPFGEEKERSMPSESNLAELERKHRALDEEIVAELSHPACDTLKLSELKRRKLRLKEEIEILRQNRSLH